MKYFIAVVALAALAAARPQNPQQDQVLRQSSDVAPDHYQYVYETSNGITANEQGQLKAAQNEEGSAISAQGSYQYTAPDGTPIQVSYVADENGFQPQGAHIPVAPGIPEHIQRALEYIRTHPQQQQ